MSFFSSNGMLILLHKGLKGVKKAQKYDIVLSPQFYISKREKLPVKYSFQAKKLAPSILEEYLPSEYGYEYVVQKSDDSWQFFAYSPKDIEEFLKNCCSIPAHKIGKIYFADQLSKVLKKLPIGIDESSALTLIDDTATIIPRSMLESDRYAKFTKRLRPNSGFNFKSSSKLNHSSGISKGAIALSLLLLLLGGVYLIEALSYKKALKSEMTLLDNIYQEYPQFQGKTTRDSIKKKYELVESKERKVRELLDTFSKLTNKKSVLNKLELEGNKYTALFNITPSEMNKVLSYAKSTNLKAKKINASLISIEGAINE